MKYAFIGLYILIAIVMTLGLYTISKHDIPTEEVDSGFVKFVKFMAIGLGILWPLTIVLGVISVIQDRIDEKSYEIEVDAPHEVDEE